jgi:hypothetical protein
MNTKKYRINIYRLDPSFTIVINENGLEIIDGEDGWGQPLRDDDVLIEEIEEEKEL